MYLKCTLKVRVDFTSCHDVPYLADLATVSKHCFILKLFQQRISLLNSSRNACQELFERVLSHRTSSRNVLFYTKIGSISNNTVLFFKVDWLVTNSGTSVVSDGF